MFLPINHATNKLGFALSGLGVVFLTLNQSLQFVFLEEQKQGVRAELVSCMIDGQKHFINSKKALCYKKLQLISSLKNITNIS